MPDLMSQPLAEITEGVTGMITLRGTQGPQMQGALTGVALGLPRQRQIMRFGAGQVAWMSPDELLILCPRSSVAGLVSGLSAALLGTHHLIADVTEARVVFHLDGPAPHQVLAKLTPTDLLDGTFPEGEMRRTRIAQIPAAFWRDGLGYSLICFRSVADYAAEVLALAARPGTAIDPL